MSLTEINKKDKTLRLYKSSTMALGRSTPALILPEGDDDNLSRKSISARASWEDDVLVRKGEQSSRRPFPSQILVKADIANSSLPMVRHAVRNEELAAANQLDRMTLWARNVESKLILVMWSSRIVINIAAQRSSKTRVKPLQHPQVAQTLLHHCPWHPFRGGRL